MTWYIHGLWLLGWCLACTAGLVYQTMNGLWLGVMILELGAIWKLGESLIDYVRERGYRV